MARLLVLAKLSTTSTAVRDEYIQRLTALSKIAADSEPETTKYAVCLPRKGDDEGKICWVIEEYASQAAFDAHMATEPVAEMIKWMQSGDILASPPDFYMLNYLDNTVFTKPDIVKLEDPFVSFAKIVYNPGQRAEAIPYWKNTFAETQAESGTYLYGLVVDKEKEDVLYTIQTYESEAYLRGVHLKENKAVGESMKVLKSMSKSVVHNELRIVGGYLNK
jgi:quinol monooxygenase YgiN